MMISVDLMIVLAIGMVIMFIPIAIQSKWRNIAIWKSAVVSLILTITGTVGIHIWFFVENFRFGGRSFYGAVFLVPIVCVLCSKLLRISYGTLTDISAPAGCAMLALMKIKCLVDDCCNGIPLYADADGIVVYFPSQIVELATAIVLMTVLLIISFRKNQPVYAWFLILYGATRFVLNFFRLAKTPYIWMLSAGHFWSLVAVVIGIIWLIVFNDLKRNPSKSSLLRKLEG